MFEDADLNVAVEGALLAKMRNTGQSCIAANRLFVQRPVYQRFPRSVRGPGEGAEGRASSPSRAWRSAR